MLMETLVWMFECSLVNKEKSIFSASEAGK